MSEISYALCHKFKQARDNLVIDKFHAVQSSITVKKWWQIVFKNSDGLTTIKHGLSQKKAEKLANELNKLIDTK
jgi:hypothetical protein